jgi:CDP-glucose 4,6-dehydratase
MNGFWNMKKCLVTGGMGFGGSHLCEQLLAQGAMVYVIDRVYPKNSYLILAELIDNVEFIQGNICDLELLKFILYRNEIDVVFHLAAQPIVPMSIALPYETLCTNATGTFAVLEAVRTSAFQPSLVFASSGAYYGTIKQSEPIDEEQAANAAANIYGPSKIAGDFAVRSYVKTYGIKAAVCRFINTYGPGSTNFSTIVPAAISKLIENQPYDFGDRDDGTSSFDYLHVRDMSRGYIDVAENMNACCGEAFNFSGGTTITVRNLVQMISVLFDGQEREPMFYGPKQEVPVCKALDYSKAKKILGWAPSTVLRDGLTETIEWYERFWPAITKKGQHETYHPANTFAKI